MAMCDWCWGRAFIRSRCQHVSQSYAYEQIVLEQEAKGVKAECPEARKYAQRAVRECKS